MAARVDILKGDRYGGVAWRSLLISLLVMLALVAMLHWGCLALISKEKLDPYELSDFYPLSVFRWRLPQPYQLTTALVFAAWVGWAWSRLSRPGARLAVTLLVGLSFAVLSNLLHGVRFGLDYPTATSGDGGIEYYHDAIAIRGPLWLLERYNAVQFELLEHTRTHPPGPVLLYWLLHRALREPALISVAIAAITLGLLMPYLRRLLRLSLGEEPPGALLLFALLPALLVYGLAVVDAPIAGLFLATVVHFVDDRRRLHWLWAGCWLFSSLFFTFGALFLLPVLAGFEFVRRKRLTHFALTLLVAALLLVGVKLLFGFDWLQGFFTASAMENDKGFLLLAAPHFYLWYRLGGVAEIAIFFTPFLWLLWRRGWAVLREQSPDAAALAWLGPASLAAMLLAGALKIGEAARACLFILPYLFLPVAAAYQRLPAPDRARVVYAVSAFGAAMQLLGFFQW